MNRTECIVALRELADFLESKPELDWALLSFPSIVVCNVNTKEELRQFAMAMSRTNKQYSDSYFHISYTLPSGADIAALAAREQVCRKIVTKRIAPAMPALPEREVEDVSWDCGEPILGDAVLPLVTGGGA